MSISRTKNKNRGTTLVEIMVAMTILTIGVIGLLGAFGSISKSVLFSKSRTLATSLAQERIESLKNYSYHRLLVTTAAVTSTEPGITPFNYDNGYYPPEQVTVGDIDFTRRVLVQKVTETGGILVPNSWQDEDTGLKLITSYVLWEEGTDWRLMTFTNLRDNPDRLPLDAGFEGVVDDGFVALDDVEVRIQENVQIRDMTDGSGAYDLTVSSGTYDLRAYKRGYFPQTQTASVVSQGTTTVNFSLVAMGSGTVEGTAYMNPNLVISEICPQVNGDPMAEYVELYNPTNQTYKINIGVSDATYILSFVYTGTLIEVELNPDSQTIYNNLLIAPSSYFVIGSSPVINGVPVDAYYSSLGLPGAVPADRIPTSTSGGIKMVSQGDYEPFGTVVDAVGWGRNGGAPYGPSTAREGQGIKLSGALGHDGLASDEVLERIAFSSSTKANMAPGGIHEFDGNAYDSGNNSDDFVHHDYATVDVPQNTTMTEDKGSGTPAIGALVFVDDGLSSSVEVESGSGGYFIVPSVATGTWSILISSSGYIYSESGLVMTNGLNIDIGAVNVSSSASQGFISGRVVDSSNNPLSGIEVVTSGGYDTTDVNGSFRFQVDSGTYNITANYQNANLQYTTAETTGVVVDTGQLSVVSDMELEGGGIIMGFMTTNGTDPLPGIPVVATSVASGAEVGSSVTNSQGEFEFTNLSVGDYLFSPQLEVGEASLPSSLSATVVSGQTIHAGTFTVTNAFATVSGVVTVGGDVLTTGALIAAVPQPNSIGTDPPELDQTLRDGSVYYYFASAGADGTYELSLRGGETYNIYAWYTDFTGGVPSTTQKSDSVAVTAGGMATVNFTW